MNDNEFVDKIEFLTNKKYQKGTCWNCFLNQEKNLKLLEIYLSAFERNPERVIPFGNITNMIYVRNKKYFCPNCFQETYGFEYYQEVDGKYIKLMNEVL